MLIILLPINNSVLWVCKQVVVVEGFFLLFGGGGQLGRKWAAQAALLLYLITGHFPQMPDNKRVVK